MSFLLGALGSLGKSFLGGGGVGGLLSRVASKVPMIGRAGTYIKDMLRSSPIARSAADYVVNKAIDVGGNLVNRFAQSDFIRRKLPIAVPYLQNGASAL